MYNGDELTWFHVVLVSLADDILACFLLKLLYYNLLLNYRSSGSLNSGLLSFTTLSAVRTTSLMWKLHSMLAQADKGRTTVIIYKEQYTNKIHNFLTENNIQPLHKNPINKDHKHIQEILQQNNLIFNKRQVKYLLKKNPTPSTLNAQLKLHKPNIPIWPVNNKNVPTYKTAKKLNDILKKCLCLDNRYNTINSTSLANDSKTYD